MKLRRLWAGIQYIDIERSKGLLNLRPLFAWIPRVRHYKRIFALEGSARIIRINHLPTP